VPYALFFRGLQLTTPVTGSLLNHTQFLLVALLAALLLGERAGSLVWGALLVLLAGTDLGMNVHLVRWNEGTLLIALSTVLFAAGVVLSKYLLAELPTLTVMTAKMSIGSAMLLGYLAVTGRLGGMAHLSATQCQYVLATGLILLAFTVTTFLALRHVSATAATAIPAAAPVITAALVSLDTQRVALSQADVLGILLMVAAAAAVFTIGRRRETRATQTRGRLVPA
jgi:drug/metabolite transporter (DMT)-like permease